MVRVKNISIGGIEFRNFKVWPMDAESWQKKGFLFKKDSVVGVIGSDILAHFIWEFDMENRLVSIYKSDEYPSNIADSLAIPLFKKGHGYFTEIEIDSIKRIVKFDSGCSGALLIQDTILNSENNFKAYSWGKNGGKRTFFSHLKKDTLQTDTSFYCMIPKLSLGIDTFRSVICQEKAEINLLGVPFFWSYEKVIADYPNKKVYFLNKKKEYSKYDIQTNTNNFIKNTFLNKRGTFRVESKSYERYDVMFVSKIDTGIQNSVQDTIPSLYKIYGESRWWGENVNNIDSILCLDSVLLPNGKIADNNYKIFGKDKYFHNN